MRRVTWSFCNVATVCVLLGTAVQSANSAPVTFAFEAEVIEVTRSVNGTFDLPFAISPGDSLNGLVQFEAILFGQSGDATKLQLNLASETFSANDVPLVTFDHYVMPISGSSVGGAFDGINVGCSTPGSCAGATSSLSGIAIDQIRLGLASGDVENFDIGESLAHSTFWNRFDLFPSGGIQGFGATRAFILELNSTANDAAGTVFIRGHLGSMIAVPEPASWHLAVLLGMLITRSHCFVGALERDQGGMLVDYDLMKSMRVDTL